jgi:hypothetical protein
VAAAVLLLVLLFTLEEKKESVSNLKLRYGIYSQLDKLCMDVNALDKIQIAIYFLMQSWLSMCDNTPDTIAFAPLKIMKKKVHDAVTKKITDFHKKDERTVEDCIITYHNTEIKPTDDDFHQMLFEMILQGYMKTFSDNVVLDESQQFLKMEAMNCNGTESCQYLYPKPPTVPKMIEVIVRKSQDNADDVREKKCIQVFQHLFLWNEKIKKPELSEWAYFLMFKGLEKALNTTDFEIKKNLHCGSSQMQTMEKAITAKPNDVNPFLITFLRERDVEIEVLEDEIDYAEDSSQSEKLNQRLKLQALMAELVLKSYMETFEVKPKDGKITVAKQDGGPPIVIEVPPMENLKYL